MIFVDTNYFLRYLLNDIDDQHKQAKELFLAGSEGKVSLTTSSLVFFEIFWVLHSVYNLSREDCIIALNNILKLSFIQMDDRNILMDTVMLFSKTNLDLEDCYNLYFAKLRKVKLFKTFDKKLEKEFNR